MTAIVQAISQPRREVSAHLEDPTKEALPIISVKRTVRGLEISRGRGRRTSSSSWLGLHAPSHCCSVVSTRLIELDALLTLRATSTDASDAAFVAVIARLRDPS